MTATSRTGRISAGQRRLRNPVFRRYRRALATPTGLGGVVVVVVLIGLAVLAPVLFPDGYDNQTADSFAPPSWNQPFGTDELGRSIFVRTVYAVQADLSLIAFAVPIAAILGTLLGLLGIINGALGVAAQRAMDVVVGFPGLVLGVSVAVVMGTGWTALVVALTLVALPQFARLARATMLAQQGRDYVQAARMFGHSSSRIVVRHVLPHTLDAMIAQSTVAVTGCIFLEAGLSIVGLGLQPPHPSLGTLLDNGTRFMEIQPSYVLGPGGALLILVLGFTLVADALNRRELD